MARKFFKNSSISRIVESQVRQWEHTRQSHPARLSGGVQIDYIAISRQIGGGGEQVARILADLMRWQLYDKDILDYLAQDMNVHKSVDECVDERTLGWIEKRLDPVFKNKSAKNIKQFDYYCHLLKVLLVLGKLGQAIIVGRAASQVLPRDHGLSIRITAPFELRCQRVADEEKIDIKNAQALVKKTDRDQKRFVREFLNKDIDDPAYYDLMYSTEKLTSTSVAKLIWRAFDVRIESQQNHAQ